MIARLRPPQVRRILAALVVIDLGSLCLFLAEVGDQTNGNAVSHALTGPLRFLVAAIGSAAALAFARRPGRVLAGLMALIALGILSTAHAQLFGSPWRHLYFSGLCLAGWLLGLCHARRHGPADDEAFAQLGALALLSAAYLNGGISKLAFGGQEWLSGVAIQALVLGQDGLVPGGIAAGMRTAVVQLPWLSAVLALAATGLELAAPLMLHGGLLRPVLALGLVGMHATIYATTGILYPEAIALLLVLGVLARPAEPAPIPATSRLFPAAVALLVLAAAAGILHQAHRFRVLAEQSQPAPVAPILRVGPFHRGQGIAPGWTVQTLERSPGHLTLTLAGTTAAGPATARFDLTCDDQPASPFDHGPAHLSYRADLPFASVEPLGQEIRLLALEGGPPDEACARWAHWWTP